jgi:hypothetical protein
VKNKEAFMTVDELDASGRRAVMVGFLWRGLVLNVLVAAAAAVVGIAITFALAFGPLLFGISPRAIHGNVAPILSAAGGLFVGVYGLWQYIRWLFRVQFAGYRLRLVPVGADDASNNSNNAL